MPETATYNTTWTGEVLNKSNGKVYGPEDTFSINGSTGAVYAEPIKMVPAELSGNFGRLMAWADEFRTLKVRTNADTPNDAKRAEELGAQGIGLCRTEHMFFDPQRIGAFREMICSDTKEEREVALKEKELDALVRKQADADKYAAEQKAEANKQVRMLEAEAQKVEAERMAEARIAKAKAERIAIITVEIILNTVTIIVLIKYLTNGAILNAIV